MGSLRALAQFERSRWRLRLLLPLWALQLGLTLTLAGLFASRLGDSLKHYDARDKAGEIPTLELVWEAANIVLSAISTICTVFEMARFLAEALTPWTVLFTHIIKLTCAVALLVLDSVAHAQRIDGHYTAVGLALDVVLLCTASALAVYAIVTYRRLSSRDSYAHSLDVKSYGFSDGLDRDNSYLESRRPSLREKRLSLTSTRLSISARRSSEPSMPLESVEQQQQRPPSYYNHERDTQFDNYMARRGSVVASNNNKEDIEMALGAADFGWASSGSPTGDDDVVSVGVVKAKSRPVSVPRAPSLSSDHVLVSVPEEEEGRATMLGNGRKAKEEAKDREALLGDSRRTSSSGDADGMVRVAQGVDLPGARWQRE